MGRLFGTDGVRGVLNVEMTPQLALRLGSAIGTYLGAGSQVLVGRDARSGGEMLVSALAAGLMSMGVRVWNAGMLPTPALQYAVRELGYDGGVMVTASHNPPEYNGIKVIAADGIEVPRSVEAEIEAIFFENRVKPVDWRGLAEGVRREEKALEKYVDGVVSIVDRDRIASCNYSVLVDPANSVGALAAPLVLRRLGVKTYTLNGHIDPGFPGREPEPTTNSLMPSARVAVALGVNLGVGFDGDADRAIFIDEKGRIHWGDRSGALLAAYLAEKHRDYPRRIYTGVSSSMLVEEYLKPRGVQVVWMKVGSVDISRRLVEEKGLCGFEENGGFMNPAHQPVRDGSATLALMLELMSEEHLPASALFDQLPRYYPVKTKIPMSREKALEALERVREAYKGERMITIDGVKIIGEDYWVLVRPSGTEPVLRIMAEAKSREKVERIVEEVKKIVLGGAR